MAATDGTRPGDSRSSRAFRDAPGIAWRHGAPPDYSMVDALVAEQRTNQHKPGSLEEIVENLVKTWEMEATHKLDYTQWETVDYQNYQVVVNGNRSFDVTEAARIGTYNMLLNDCPLYDATRTFDDSHSLFRKTFKDGFPWELLKVLSGPPNVTFTWRHWASWTGPYNGTPPTGELIELFGICIATVTEDLKIQKLEIFSDPNPMIHRLSGRCPASHEG